MKELSRNPSFTPSPGLRQELQDKRESLGVTGRLNQIWDRYELILQYAPGLSDQEQCLLETILSDSARGPLWIKHLDSEIEDSAAGNPDERQALAARIRSISYAHRVALIERLGF